MDSEVLITHDGKLVEQLFSADDVIQVGQAFAILETEGGEEVSTAKTKTTTAEPEKL